MSLTDLQSWLLKDGIRDELNTVTRLTVRQEVRPKTERLSEEDRLERDRPLFELIESTKQRWAREHAARCKRPLH